VSEALPGDIITESGVNVSAYRRDQTNAEMLGVQPKPENIGKKIIVNFSGGLCSFWAAKRVVAAYGKENTILLFADTLIEDSDLYRFSDQCAAHLGIPITRICVGLTPWQLFRKEGLIGNARFKICSIRLKREPLNAWMESHYEMDKSQSNAFFQDGVIALGMDWNESHRVQQFQAAHPTWSLLAPMTEAPIWDKCRMIRETEALGIDIPRAYRLGFPHNNCKMRCVAAGISHFVHLLAVDPEGYNEWEVEELVTQDDFRKRGIDDSFTILKDRRGGTTKPLSLRDLRLRVEAGEKFPTDDWGGCGCSLMEPPKEPEPHHCGQDAGGEG